MREFDFVYTQEDINDKCKTVNKAITVTITLGEYRSLVEEKQRLECELFKLNDVIADLQMKYEGMKEKYYKLQDNKSGYGDISQTASLPKIKE